MEGYMVLGLLVLTGCLGELVPSAGDDAGGGGDDWLLVGGLGVVLLGAGRGDVLRDGGRGGVAGISAGLGVVVGGTTSGCSICSISLFVTLGAAWAGSRSVLGASVATGGISSGGGDM